MSEIRVTAEALKFTTVNSQEQITQKPLRDSAKTRS